MGFAGARMSVEQNTLASRLAEALQLLPAFNKIEDVGIELGHSCLGKHDVVPAYSRKLVHPHCFLRPLKLFAGLERYSLVAKISGALALRLNCAQKVLGEGMTQLISI